MNTITIDVSSVADRPGFHDLMTEALCLPSWYGRNVDALYDCLTDISEETSLIFTGWEEMQRHIGLYAIAAKTSITAAGEMNPNLTVQIS